MYSKNSSISRTVPNGTYIVYNTFCLERPLLWSPRIPSGIFCMCAPILRQDPVLLFWMTFSSESRLNTKSSSLTSNEEKVLFWKWLLSQISIFMIMPLCASVISYQRFWGACCLLTWDRSEISGGNFMNSVSKHLKRLQDALTQMDTVQMFTAM
jgi:hypothetical protein